MNISPEDFNRLHKFYIEGLQAYGNHDARSVQWASDYNQLKRFQILTAIDDLHDKSILDFGCGLGELYKYFLNQKISVMYTGIDIMPEFISIAKHRFPDAQFLQQNIFDYDQMHDYVIASGAFSFKVQDYTHFYYSIIEKLFSLSKKGLAFNMLQKDHHVDDDLFATYSPIEVVEFCKTFCDTVEVVTDYLQDDFSVYLRK